MLKRCTGPCGRDLDQETAFSKKGGGRIHSRCKECRNASHLSDVQPAREYYAANRDKILSGVRKRRAAYRLEALKHYGGDPPRCACLGCGEWRIPFLTLDHVEGNGNEHRRSLSKSRKDSRNPGGLAVYYWLRNNSYPSGFRVLCFNCNCAIGAWGECPHQDVNSHMSPRANKLWKTICDQWRAADRPHPSVQGFTFEKEEQQACAELVSSGLLRPRTVHGHTFFMTDEGFSQAD